MDLTDYKVRVLDGERATSATVRISMAFRFTDPSTHEEVEWVTTGADPNIITATVMAMVDGYEFLLSTTNENESRKVVMKARATGIFASSAAAAALSRTEQETQAQGQEIR